MPQFCKTGLSYLIVVLVSVTLYNCTPNYQEVINKENAEFTLQLEISKDVVALDRFSSISSDNIKLDNILLESCLSTLLNKDTSFIHFEKDRKKNIMLKGEYKNLRQNPTLNETKKDMMEELKKALNFSMKEEVPTNTYLLTEYDSLLLMKNTSEKVPNDQSTIFSSTAKKELKFTNANLQQIVDGLNKFYACNIILNENEGAVRRYSFNLENIPFEGLENYLKNKMGLSLMPYNEDDFPQGFDRITKIVFLD